MQYNVQLEAFSGPLDLLLHLIKEAKLDIKEIHISSITSQYIEFLSQCGELDMETASDFILMASLLLYIKSRQLLPRQQITQDESGLTPEQQLVMQLREYKAYKEASELMEICKQEADLLFVKLAEEYPLPPPPIIIAGLSIDNLYAALERVLLRKLSKPEPTVVEILRDNFSIAQGIAHIRKVIGQNRVLFATLLKSGNKYVIVTTFIALLELIAKGEVSVFQENDTDDIYVCSKVLI